MKVVIDLVCVVLLIFVAKQDFMERKISVWALLSLFLLFTVKSIMDSTAGEVLNSFLISTGFVLLQLFIVTLYFSLRKKKLTSITDSYLGLGDIAFFIITAALFNSVWYITFFLLSMLLSLVFFGSYIIYKRNNAFNIPLAGFMSLIVVVLFCLQYLIPGLAFRDSSPFLDVLSKYEI